MANDTTTPDIETEETPQFDVEIADAGPACKALTITIPESRIKEKVEESYQTLQDDAVLPGFRRGRAPRRLLEKRFASGVSDDVKNALLSETYTKAMEDNGLDPLGDPEVDDIENLKLPDSGDLTFTVKIEVTPDVELPAFDSIKVEKTKIDVTDENVTEEIERIRDQAGTPTQPEDAAIEIGDYVTTDTTILAGEDAGEDAEVIAEFPGTHILVNGEDKEFKGHVAGIVVEALGKKLEGKKPGDELTVSMTGPGGHENEDIKDKPITLKLALTAIHRIEPASIETVAERMGLQSEDELNDRVKTMLEQRAEQNQQADLYQQVCDQLVEQVELELPEGITGRQTERVLRRQAMDLVYRGTPESEVEEKMAEMRGESEEAAIKQLKQFFILDKASKDMEVDVDENELNQRIVTMAMQQNRRPDKLRQEMMRQGQIEQLYLQLREQKTLDKIIEQASVTEVEAEAEESA
ncbi:MAG: trigger factor [Planctomycetota bacterium]